MFKRFKKMSVADRPKGYDEGQRLFNLGAAAAGRERFREAFVFYSKSISACPNPAPYLNRARILVKKIRHKEVSLMVANTCTPVPNIRVVLDQG